MLQIIDGILNFMPHKERECAPVFFDTCADGGFRVSYYYYRKKQTADTAGLCGRRKEIKVERELGEEKTVEYRVLLNECAGEIEEKKSRFICAVRPVHSEEEAVSFVEKTKKKYWDARHNCSAFVLGSRQELTRCSDDGEPGGTAGRPILEVLLGEGLSDVAAVVTRYFGGTLLGTGGLVRAYSGAVKEALKHAETGMMRYGVKLRIGTDYNNVGKLQHLFAKRGIQAEAEYGEGVCFTVLIPVGTAESVKKEVTEATNGKAAVEEVEKIYFIDKE